MLGASLVIDDNPNSGKLSENDIKIIESKKNRIKLERSRAVFLGRVSSILWRTLMNNKVEIPAPTAASVRATSTTSDAPSTQYYLNESKVDIGIPNVVTSILAGYRAFDTLGEVLVIFIAGISVLGILREEKDNG